MHKILEELKNSKTEIATGKDGVYINKTNTTLCISSQRLYKYKLYIRNCQETRKTKTW